MFQLFFPFDCKIQTPGLTSLPSISTTEAKAKWQIKEYAD